ncbi:Zn-dependent hydrolase, including glyoxylase [Thermoplasmatales archaeon BRNA1]|nr:Zn-dependent hydrolase, including glyoxylase [Thermoplasmatales archaeon BRNA1]
MTSIDVLVIGHLERDADGNVIPGETFSTSTLIRCPGHNIVVDTSGESMKPGIKIALKQIGKVFPEDIDTVVLTHVHPDHIGNNGMFPKAKVIIHSGEELEGAEVIEVDEVEIAKGVKLVHTPGHSAGSMSVFVEGEDRRYAIAGDAIPTKDNLVKGIPPRLNVDEKQALESMNRISKWADVIVPGHGAPFINPKR